MLFSGMSDVDHRRPARIEQICNSVIFVICASPFRDNVIFVLRIFL